MSAPPSTRCRCAKCQAVLDAGELEGLCPACLCHSVAIPDVFPAAGPLVIPGCQLLEVIGRGGAGIVYRARASAPDRIIAVKVLAPHALTEISRQRLAREARVLAALDHPGVLPVLEIGDADGIPWLAMKFAGGGTLAGRLTEFPGDPRRAAGLMAAVAETLHFVHSRGILHRDLKPANLLFDSGGHCLIADFGLAAATGETSVALTIAGGWMGTPHYLAPEVIGQGMAASSAASDLWSLGVILAELLTGRRPWDVEPLPALLQAILTSDPPALPGVPAPLAAICQRCLARDPASRFADAGEFAADLRRWLAGHPVHARRAGPRERAALWVRRNRALTTLAGIATLTLAVGGAVGLHHHLRSKKFQSESMLAQAIVARKSGQPGQRERAISLLQRAVSQTPALSPLARPEALAALALADLIPEQTLRETAPEKCGVPLRPVQHPATTERPLAAVASPGGEWTAAWDPARRAILLRSAAGAPPVPLNDEGREAVTLDFTPDGATLISADAAGTVRFWDTATGWLLLSAPGVPGPVAQSTDGSRILYPTAPGALTLARWSPSPVFRALPAGAPSAAGIEVPTGADGEVILPGLTLSLPHALPLQSAVSDESGVTLTTTTGQRFRWNLAALREGLERAGFPAP